MHPINKMRLLSGITIDPEIEKEHARKQRQLKEDVSLRDMHSVESHKGMTFYLVTTPSSISEPADIISKCNGESFALIFMGAGGHHMSGGGGARQRMFKENWTLYHEHEMRKAIMDANNRMKTHGNSNEVITEELLEAMEPFKALDGSMKAIEKVIKHLQSQIKLFHGNQHVARVDKKDHDAYERILSLLHKGNIEQAKHLYHDMDTAAREHIADSKIVTKKAERKAASVLFGFNLLHESEIVQEGFADLFLSSKERSSLMSQDMKDKILEAYKRLRGKGIPPFKAVHMISAAKEFFELPDSVIKKVIVAAGINESKELVDKGFFSEGDKVEDKSGKVWKVTGTDKGDGISEIFKLKDMYSSDTSSDVASNLRKIEESTKDLLVEYQGYWNRVDKGLMEKLFALRKEQPNTAHRIIAAAKIHVEKGDIEGANRVIEDALRGNMRESVHYYDEFYKDYEEDEEKPVNVADGSSNDEQVYDDMERKPESPNQLREPGELSKQDNSEYDINKKMTVPSNITGALRTEADKARSEANKLDVRDKASAQFYRDLGKAFDDLRGHLEKGTVYDVKQAQIFATTLMGPMLHKLPNDVWKWLTNSGKTRSLKDYMKEVGNEAKLKKGFDPSKEKAA